MRIYDASAFFEHISRRSLELDSFILDLTVYEAGNVVVKHAHQLKKISGEEARSLLAIISNWGNLLYIDQDDLEAIYKIAAQESLTFYDAAYINAAVKYDTILETCDRKMHKAAEKYCKCELVTH